MTLTDKEELIRVLELCESGCEHCKHADARYRCEYGSAYETACSVICDAPEIDAVDVVPVKRGKWLFDEFDGSAQCSECMAVVEADEWENHNWYFCYHCGARMENWNE